MKITRQRLKNIIMEEMSLVEGNTEDIINSGDDDDNKSGMGSISETEGIELAQQVAQVLFDTGVTAAESPEQLAMAIGGIGRMALLALGGGALGVAAKAGTDAIAKLRSQDAAEEAEMPLEEEQEGTLEELITQAIQEELEQISQRNVN